MAKGRTGIDFSSHADAEKKSHYVPQSEQRNLAQFDADNEKTDRLAELRKQRAKDRARRKKEGKK